MKGAVLSAPFNPYRFTRRTHISAYTYARARKNARTRTHTHICANKKRPGTPGTPGTPGNTGNTGKTTALRLLNSFF